MEETLPVAPRILLVERDSSLQSLLAELLGLEGYAVSVCSSLEEVPAQLALETFGLVLADVYVGRAHAGSFTPAHRLRRLVSPTPLGLLMTNPFSLGSARRAGFAFVQPMPFELEDLLAQVVGALQTPLSAEHALQVQVVERFFTAREHEDWSALLALCTEEVVCYSLGASNGGLPRRMQGQAALRTCLMSATHAVHGQTFLHFEYAALPHGLLARYMRLWTTPEGERRRAAKIALFHFRGEQIAQVGLRLWGPHHQVEIQAG